MLSLDLSGSMQIRDMQVGNRTISRVEAVKAIASDFTERRVGDRVGLILFGSKAYVQAPLTFDTTTVTQFIREAQLASPVKTRRSVILWGLPSSGSEIDPPPHGF